MSVVIRLEQASLGYRKSVVLREISCSIRKGERVGLVGPNGSGKTTFLKGLLGLVTPISGTIHVDRTQKFAYVPQAEGIRTPLPLSVQDVVELPCRSQRPFGSILDAEKVRVQETMRSVGIHSIARLLFREVSGGQKQKAILAQAMVQNPDVLLLDEPTRGLDVVAEQDLLSNIQNLGAPGGEVTVLFVTHALQIPLNFMDRILLFERGQVVSVTPEELLKTKKLEEIYGIPFIHQESQGMKWVMPVRRG